MSSRSIRLAAGLSALLLAAPAAAEAPGPGSAAPANTGRPSLFYVTAPLARQWSSTEMIGAHVLDRNQRAIGVVEQLIVDGDGRVIAVVLGIGGFLGFREHRVAVSMQAFSVWRDPSGKVQLLSALDQAELLTAPTFVSATRWSRGRARAARRARTIARGRRVAGFEARGGGRE